MPKVGGSADPASHVGGVCCWLSPYQSKALSLSKGNCFSLMLGYVYFATITELCVYASLQSFYQHQLMPL